VKIAVVVGDTWAIQPQARSRLFAALNSLVLNLFEWEIICGRANVGERWVEEWAAAYKASHAGKYCYTVIEAQVNAYGYDYRRRGNRSEARAERDRLILADAQALFAVWDEHEWRIRDMLKDARGRNLPYRLLRYERVRPPSAMWRVQGEQEQRQQRKEDGNVYSERE